MSESQTTKPISVKQINFIKKLANDLREHLTEVEVANLKARLADTSALTTKWGSDAIEKLKRIETRVNLEKLRAARIKSSSEG
jgi:hypothetical protein